MNTHMILEADYLQFFIPFCKLLSFYLGNKSVSFAFMNVLILVYQLNHGVPEHKCIFVKLDQMVQPLIISISVPSSQI